jgi:hypothetical protein
MRAQTIVGVLYKADNGRRRVIDESWIEKSRHDTAPPGLKYNQRVAQQPLCGSGRSSTPKPIPNCSRASRGRANLFSTQSAALSCRLSPLVFFVGVRAEFCIERR